MCTKPEKIHGMIFFLFFIIEMEKVTHFFFLEIIHTMFFFFFLIYIQKASKTYKTPIVTPGKKKKTQTVKKSKNTSTTPRLVKKNLSSKRMKLQKNQRISM